MSVKLTTQDLTGAAPGKTGTFDWTPYVQVRSEAMPQAPSAHLMIRNDTGCALDVQFRQSGKSNYISPGQWPTFVLAPDDTSMAWTVESVIAGGNYAKLAAIYYAPGEELDEIGSLGNSPLSGNVTSQFSPANEFEQDFFNAGFVLTGLVSSKDLVTVNQLDVTAGVAFLVQADSGWGRVAPLAATFLTSTPSTTYFLDLNPDGTFSFATSHSAVSNHITICSLTTDGSGNILAVTDARVLNATMLSAMSGSLAVPPLLGTRGGRGILGTLVAGDALDIDSSGNLYLKVPASMAINLQSPNGSTQTEFGGSALGVLKLGGQNAVGNFGVPVIVAQALDVAVAVTTLQTILTYAVTATGYYRLTGYFETNNGSTPESITYGVTYTDANTNNSQSANFVSSTDPAASSTTAAALVNGGVGIASTLLAHPMATMLLKAKTGTNILVQYHDPAGTPNDLVTVFIERLS